MQEDNNIVSPDPDYVAYQESARREEENKKKRRTIIIWVSVIVAVIVIAVIVFFVVNNNNNSESSLKSRLENYATDIYSDIKDIRNEKYITLDLNYFERYDYDISYFDNQLCSRTDTYVVIIVDDNKEIEEIVTILSCGENAN